MASRDRLAASALSDRRRDSARLPDIDDAIAECAQPDRDSFDEDWPAAKRRYMVMLLNHVNKCMSEFGRDSEGG